MNIPKPNFIIIGFAKCGTTTLADMLASHPDCCFSSPKEVGFFSVDKNYAKGWKWYSEAFSHYNGQKLIGEATTHYTMNIKSAICAKRIHEFYPKMKIVCIVRHPYERMISDWKMLYGESRWCRPEREKAIKAFKERHDSDLSFAWNLASKGFENYVRFEYKGDNYLDNFRFDHLLEPYRNLFPDKQIKILFLEEWREDPDSKARELCDFLGLDFARLTSINLAGLNRSDQRLEFKPFFRFIKEASWTKPFLKILPRQLAYKMKMKFCMKPVQYPKATLSSEYKKYMINYIKSDAESFLKRYGKPASFWDFDKI